MRKNKQVKNTAVNKKMFQGIEEFIEKKLASNNNEGILMAALHKAQDTFGYIPKEAMELISKKLDVPQAHIYGMATFYNYFSLTPKAKYRICVCKGTACYVAGGARILSKLKKELRISEGESTSDGLFSLDITRCLGCCGLSPVMQINDKIYVRMVPEKIPAILSKYRKISSQGGAKDKLR